jgi:predicted nucleotidyltransferase
MMLDDKLVTEIVKRVTSVARPTRVLVFGSVARGMAATDSDIDLLVLENHVTNAREESIRIRRSLRGMGMPFDVVVMSTEWFDRTKDVVGGLAYPAHREGKVIYAA